MDAHHNRHWQLHYLLDGLNKSDLEIKRKGVCLVSTSCFYIIELLITRDC